MTPQKILKIHFNFSKPHVFFYTSPSQEKFSGSTTVCHHVESLSPRPVKISQTPINLLCRHQCRAH